MRNLRLIPCALLAVACGDNGGSNKPIDAAPNPIDSPDVDIDAPPDGDVDIDAPPDAPPGAAARVWVVGDFLTDQTRQAGGFLADATLPFNTATPPPTVVPATGELFDGTGAQANVFTARGAKIAYVADQTVAGRFDLYIANADNSNPTLLVMGQTGIEITAASISPDGTKVGFLMDGSLLGGGVDNGFDLHMVPAAGGASVKLSPDRVSLLDQANMDVFNEFEWSADSKFIAFSADLDESGFDQPHVVDTTVATPTAVKILARNEIATQANGAQGVRGRLLFDNANNVYFRARVSTANASQFTFFKSDSAGAETIITTPARGDATVSDIGAFGITPDGSTLVFSADTPTIATFNLFTQAIVNPQAPVNITNLTEINGATLRAEFTTPLFFSPDSTRVAVVANYLTGAANAFEPFVIRLDGSATTRLTAITVANIDTEQLVWADNATIFAQGDLATNNDVSVFKLDAATADQTPVLAVGVPTGGDIVNIFSVPQ